MPTTNKGKELFFDLIHILTGKEDTLQHSYDTKEWLKALSIAQEQAIAGVLLSALEKLPKEQLPPQPVVLQWIGLTEMTERNTRRLEQAGQMAVDFFHKEGFSCQILKGTSVGRYYPNPLRRTAGDIDVWLDGGRKKIYQFARNYDKEGKLYGVNYHHIHFHLFKDVEQYKDVELEAHVWPSFLCSPFCNHQFHKFCNLYKPTKDVSSTSLDFDRVFILLHCYRHMNDSGVGLRQIMDYYYVLKQGFTKEERDESVKWIKRLGMYRYAAGLMWLMGEVFGLESEYQLVTPNEKEGRFILQEVMLTGNMGHSDQRDWGSRTSASARFFYNLRRDLYLVGHYPHETLWQPLFSIWLYVWRLAKGLLKDRED